MTIVRADDQVALLVVDVQVGVMRHTWDAERIIQNICIAVQKARGAGVPIIWIQHSENEMTDDSPAWQIVPELSPVQGDIHIHKHYNSAFEQTSLQETLTQLGITHIVLVGAATSWCIRATAYAALERGYNLTLIKDAHTTETLELENGIQIQAAQIIDELNIAMTWLNYPGRTNNTASIADLDFAVPGLSQANAT